MNDIKKARDQFTNFLQNCPEAYKWLRKKCYVDKTAYYPGDASVRDFREGRRSIFYEIKDLIKEPKMFEEMDKQEFFVG